MIYKTLLVFNLWLTLGFLLKLYKFLEILAKIIVKLEVEKEVKVEIKTWNLVEVELYDKSPLLLKKKT